MRTKLVVLILTHERRGRGLKETDPVRLVPQLYTLDGTLICESDYTGSGRPMDLITDAIRKLS